MSRVTSLPQPIGVGAPGFATSERGRPTAQDGASPFVHVPSSLWIVSIAFALCLSLTVLIAAVPSLRFALPWPGARVPIETLGVVVAAMAAVLAYFRYSLTGARSFLFVTLAFVAIGLNRFVFGVAGGESGATTDLDVYLWTAGRLVMAGLLLLGALPSGRAWRPDVRPLRDLLVGSAVVVTIMTLGEFFLVMNGDRLPELATSFPNDPGTITGLHPGLSVTDLSLALLGAGGFFAAAALYARPGTGANAPLLAPALVLAAFAHVHYLLMPTVFGGWVSTGDLLRLEFSIAVMVGLMMEVRRAYGAERDQMRELAFAYAAERERVEELEALDRTRAELFRMATHELMHPVSALRSWIVILQRRWNELDDEHKVEVLHKLDAESQRLRDLAERTPEMTGTEALIFPIVPRTQSVLQLVKDAASSAGLDGRLTVDLGPDPARAFVRADATRVLQVFWNLLSNATKHAGGDGPVGIVVRRSGAEMVFTVADRGPGIPPEDLGRVFDLAYGRTSAEGRTSGSRLGLYICRRIVEAHAGRTWAESRPGGGTRISFTLPLSGGER